MAEKSKYDRWLGSVAQSCNNAATCYHRADEMDAAILHVLRRELLPLLEAAEDVAGQWARRAMPTKPDKMSDRDLLRAAMDADMSGDYDKAATLEGEILGRMAAGREAQPVALPEAELMRLWEPIEEEIRQQFFLAEGRPRSEIVCKYARRKFLAALAQPLPSETEPRSEQ